MSTSPDLVRTLSNWLAGHTDLPTVRKALAEANGHGPESQKLIAELRGELERTDVSGPQLQPLVRETIEAVALGD
jgi:hypothetical protein